MDEPLKLPELRSGFPVMPPSGDGQPIGDLIEAVTITDARAYGAACARAALEEAAKVCESRFPSEVYDPEKGIEERAFADCAAAIRNLKVGE